MASFIFGGDTNETPESIKRKRDIARALLQASAPRNVGEGISALGDGIVSAVMNSRADKAEKTGMASADSAWARILGGSTSHPTAGATGGSMPTVAGSDVPVASLDMNGNDIFTSFMDTVKGSGVTNPNALAAVAATGKHESGFSPGNINRRWSDPSESGQAGTSGGAMSWRAERLANLENFARSNGEDPRNISPATQAKFFLQEDPQLVARLNTAKTPEEAQQMMNEAWKFAGWNRPGGEAAARIATAKAFLPSFMEQGDTGAEAIETIAPLNGGEAATGGQSVTSENFDDRFGETLLPHQIAQGRSGVANALQQPSQQMQQPQQAQAQIPAEFAGSQQLQSAMQNPRGSIVQALMEGQPADPAQIAQARAQGANVGQPQQGPLGIDPSILEALNNPFLSDGRKAVLKTMVEQKLAQQEEQRQQQMKQSDPAYQMDMERKRLELEALKNPQQKVPESVTALRMRAEAAGLKEGTPEYSQFMITGGGKDGVNVTVNNGEPGDGSLRKKLDEKTGERWADLQELGTTSAANAQDFQVLDELIKVAPQGPIEGRLAEMFPGVSSAGAAFQSIVKRIAPTLRAPGSGATSDIEYDGMLKSLPALSNKPEANAMISSIMRAKSAINVERSAVIDEYSRGRITAGEARAKIAEIDKKSIMTPEMKQMLEGLTSDGAAKGGRIPAGTVEDGFRFKGGDPSNPDNWEQEM